MGLLHGSFGAACIILEIMGQLHRLFHIRDEKNSIIEGEH